LLFFFESSTWAATERSKHPRKRTERLYLGSRTLAEVKALLDGRASGRILATRNRTPLNSGDVNRDVLRPICRQVGIAVGTIHAFGHVEYGDGERRDAAEKLEISHRSPRMTARPSLRTAQGCG